MLSQKTYCLASGVLFLLIALGHLLRIVFGLQWVVEETSIPMWASWVALFVAGYLGLAGLMQGKKQPAQ